MSLTGIAKLDRFIDRINTIPMDNIIGESLRENKEFVEDLIGEQHEAGIDGTGQRIKPEYTQTTIRLKTEAGQISNRVTLKNKGDYRKSITQVILRDRADIFATDSKADELSEKYGKDILDHTEESKQDIREQILPDLIEDTKNYITNG